MDPVRAADLGRQAYATMAASFSPLPRGLVASFRIWHFPPAGRHVSWVIFNRRDDEPIEVPPIARRVSWNRDRDLEELAVGPRRRPPRKPSISFAESELEEPQLNEFMKEASLLVLPGSRLARPYLSDHRAEFGLEGFDLGAIGGREIIRMEWDRMTPLSLEAISHWADRLRAWLADVPGFRDV